MTEEEYFRKTYPDSCYGDRPLSPYWDFFQDGVEFGERQSEKKIDKAKEIIKGFLSIPMGIVPYDKIHEQAEQFIKEIEK